MALRALQGPTGGGSPVGGSGTPGTIPVWSSGTTLGDSLLLQETLAVYTPSFDTASTFAFGVKDATTNVSFGKRGSLRIQASSAIAGANAMGGGDLTLKAGDNYAGSATGTDGNVILRAGYNLLSTPFSLGSIQFVTSNAEQMRITAGGNVGIGTASPASRLDVAGTITCDDAGTGLKLPATPGNADTQTLDAYQENTGWVPGISFGGGTTGITYTTQTGSWTRIGNLVFVTGRIVLSSKGSSTGAARITNLPATVGASNADGGGSVGAVSNITFGGQLMIYPVSSQSVIGLTKNTSGGAAADLTDADFTNTSAISFSLVYRV